MEKFLWHVEQDITGLYGDYVVQGVVIAKDAEDAENVLYNAVEKDADPEGNEPFDPTCDVSRLRVTKIGAVTQDVPDEVVNRTVICIQYGQDNDY
jgi:hypothetical protein